MPFSVMNFSLLYYLNNCNSTLLCRYIMWLPLSTSVFTFVKEKGMAIHSNTLDWKIPWTEEPGGLQSKGSQRVRHDWTDLAHMHLKVHTLNHSDAWIPKTLCWEKETIYKILHTVNTIWFHFYEVQKQVELINGDRNQSYCFCGVGHCLDKGTREIKRQTKSLHSTASTHNKDTDRAKIHICI